MKCPGAGAPPEKLSSSAAPVDPLAVVDRADQGHHLSGVESGRRDRLPTLAKASLVDQPGGPLSANRDGSEGIAGPFDLLSQEDDSFREHGVVAGLLLQDLECVSKCGRHGYLLRKSLQCLQPYVYTVYVDVTTAISRGIWFALPATSAMDGEMSRGVSSQCAPINFSTASSLEKQAGRSESFSVLPRMTPAEVSSSPACDCDVDPRRSRDVQLLRA